MVISITSLVQGLAQRLRKKRQPTRFPALSWTTEKMLKHQDEKKIKHIKVSTLRIAYKRPYEVLHTYKELFGDEIYFFKADTDSPLVIDCGANIGLSVLYFKSLYPSATVIAFEPDADNLELLKKNLSINNINGVECRQSAVWTANGELLFASDGTQGSGIADRSKSSNVVKVKSERLADVLQNRKVDFLKIDIEGAELEVVKDCAPFLHNVKNLFVEYHGKANDSNKLAELLVVLKENFQIYIKMAADNLKHPFFEKTTGASFDVQLNIFCYPLQ